MHYLIWLLMILLNRWTAFYLLIYVELIRITFTVPFNVFNTFGGFLLFLSTSKQWLRRNGSDCQRLYQSVLSDGQKGQYGQCGQFAFRWTPTEIQEDSTVCFIFFRWVTSVSMAQSLVGQPAVDRFTHHMLYFLNDGFNSTRGVGHILVF